MNDSLFRIKSGHSWSTETHFIGWEMPPVIASAMCSADTIETTRDVLCQCFLMAPSSVFAAAWLLGAYKLGVKVKSLSYMGSATHVERIGQNRLKVFAGRRWIEIRLKVKDARYGAQLDALVMGVG